MKLGSRYHVDEALSEESEIPSTIAKANSLRANSRIKVYCESE